MASNNTSNKKNQSKKTSKVKVAEKRSWREFFGQMKEEWFGSREYEDTEDMPKGEIIRFSIGGVMFVVSSFILLSLTSHLFTGDLDQSWQQGARAFNWMGKMGLFTAKFFIEQCFGLASFALPIFFIATSLRIMRIYKVRLWKWFIHCSVLMIWVSAAGDFFFRDIMSQMHSHISIGGAIGMREIEFLEEQIGTPGAFIILLGSLIAYLIYITSRTISVIRQLMHPKDYIKGLAGGKNVADEEDEIDDIALPGEVDNVDHSTTIEFNLGDDAETEIPTHDEGLQMVIDYPNEGEAEPTEDKSEKDIPTEMTVHIGEEEEAADLDEEGALEPYDPKLDLENYHYPTIDLLKKYETPTSGIDMKEQQENKDRIITVLMNFGVKISSIKATVGPTITLYEITPAPGVRISKIRNLEDDIALSLSALGIRIIAPIPGKGTIGIEVPNAKPQIVSMESIINSKKFQETTFELPMALGKTITNEIYMVDLAKMPHLLVAGATGQGKSVGLNAIITSLLYKKHPAELKLVMVDPKKVEFSVYSPIINHFLAQVEGNEDDEPIITDVQKVVQTLKSLCVEMDARYDLLKKAGARNLKEYNEKFKNRKLSPLKGHRFLPYIVVIIDEFGDLIMTAGKEIELPICRIAQLARAVGIHMIIATQRPTTNIITGTIKANFPARMAFKVSAMVDSRTILDRPGANQLVGKGDMLFMAGADPTRVQCAFVDTPEVERMTEFIAEQQGYQRPYPLPEVPIEGEDGDGPDVDLTHLDEMFEQVARLVVQTQQGSTSMIQRKFSIGYNRAGRLMDQLEVAGIVGPAHGSKPREVLCMSEEDLEFRIQNLKN